MKWIKHRVNKIADLKTIETTWGVEIDLRSDLSKKGQLHLSHDPWEKGDDFESWLREYQHCNIQGPLILNTKEDGLEARCLELMNQYRIGNFFFLDTALPTLVKWAVKNSESRFSLRLSKYEPAAALENFYKKAQWLWVDCFDGDALGAAELEPLKKHFRICLVSPELQGKGAESLRHFKALLPLAEAICTKYPERWLKEFSI